jgi:hypothetical protein
MRPHVARRTSRLTSGCWPTVPCASRPSRRQSRMAFYFVTEHSRMTTLQNEIGATKSFEKLTGPELNNKFGLVRAVFE